MKKVITFEPIKENTAVLGEYPKPSIKFLPDWYKDIPPFSGGDKKLKFPLGYGMPNVTVKRCVPFLDAITAGYTAYLEEDVHVEILSNGDPLVRWRSPDELITKHTSDQFPGLPIPKDFYVDVFKWVNNWTVKTPKNYSVLFTHPLNRIDLPFYTFSGLVNCDKYFSPVQFPFVIKKDFEGIIPSGTPICQLNIIKNESWSTKVLPYDKNETYKNEKKFYKTFVGSYKSNFWNRHSYK